MIRAACRDCRVLLERSVSSLTMTNLSMGTLLAAVYRTLIAWLTFVAITPELLVNCVTSSPKDPRYVANSLAATFQSPAIGEFCSLLALLASRSYFFRNRILVFRVRYPLR
jgi:hypothetical protein